MLQRLLLLYSLILLSSCGSVDEKDSADRPNPLVEFTPTLTLKTLWVAYAADNTGYLTLTPTIHEKESGGARDSVLQMDNQTDDMVTLSEEKVNDDIDTSYLKLVPAFHKGQLFTAFSNGHVRAFKFSDGKSVWQQKIDVPISAGPGIGEGILLVGSSKGEVVALSETEGTELWRAQVSSEVLAIPQISKGVVVVRTIDGKLFGLDSQTGKRLWVYERPRVPLLTLRGTSSPILKDNMILAGFDDGKLALLDLHTGKILGQEIPIAIPRGRTELERMVDIDADPQWIDNIIYVTSYQGGTVALDMTRGGQKLWDRKLSSHTGLDVEADYLYMSDTKSHIWALDRFSGEDWWKQDKLQARKVTAPVSIGDYVVVGDTKGYLHWMRHRDGKFVARYHAGKASITVPPLVVGDTLVAYNNHGKIVVLRPE